jgi:hypothetical protein
MVFWVPQAGAVGLGVSILSYADVCRIGIAADRNLVPDPSSLPDRSSSSSMRWFLR